MCDNFLIIFFVWVDLENLYLLVLIFHFRRKYDDEKLLIYTPKEHVNYLKELIYLVSLTLTDCS